MPCSGSTLQIGPVAPAQPAIRAVGVLTDEPHENLEGQSSSAMLLCQAASWQPLAGA